MAGRNRRGPIATLLNQKPATLNWDQHNFLECLLIHCAVASRQVPNESHRSFRISKPATDPATCVIYKIDRQPDPLVDEGRRPDYLVAYVDAVGCILTIVEMKGRDEKKARYGVGQITSLHAMLRTQLREHLPAACASSERIHIQGVLLTAPGVQVPNHQIQAANLPISVFPYLSRAELYPYVSVRSRKSEVWRQQQLREPDGNWTVLERILTSGLLHGFAGRTAFHDARTPKHVGKSGVRLDAADPASPDDGYLSISAEPGSVTAWFSAQGLHDRILAALQAAGGPCSGLVLHTAA